MKNKILSLFVGGTILSALLISSDVERFLNTYFLGYSSPDVIKLILGAVIFCPVFLFFSIITYKMPSKAFEYWWKFARYAIPLVFILSIPISIGLFHSPGGFFNLDDLTDFFLYALLAVLFTIGSIIQIIRGYRQKS
jgi:hypothetical protein